MQARVRAICAANAAMVMVMKMHDFAVWGLYNS